MQGFIEDSVNVPLYQPIEGWTPFNIARRAGYLAFGVLEGTEPNPNFMEGRTLSCIPPQRVPLVGAHWPLLHRRDYHVPDTVVSGMLGSLATHRLYFNARFLRCHPPLFCCLRSDAGCAYLSRQGTGASLFLSAFPCST